MERNFVKGIISKLLAKSYNYMACTHDQKAQSMCDSAEKYSKPSSEWDDNMRTLSKSRFCPRPDTEPDLICQAEKWYFAVNNQHNRALNGLDAFESFQGDRFKFRGKELFRESYDNYLRCGNNCTNLDWHKGPFSRDMAFAGIFHIPTCQSDKLHLEDFTQYWGWKAHPGKSWNGYRHGEWTGWNFPAVCGDHHAGETKSFLEAMNAGVFSDVYAHHYSMRSTDQLWRDRIPRVSNSTLQEPETYLLFDSNLRRSTSPPITTSWPCAGRVYTCPGGSSWASPTARFPALRSRVSITAARTSRMRLHSSTSTRRTSGSASTRPSERTSRTTPPCVTTSSPSCRGGTCGLTVRGAPPGGGRPSLSLGMPKARRLRMRARPTRPWIIRRNE
jgi:hypothetical protein